MGDLLLCNYPIAAMPFYVEALSCNIYSLEELCYLIEHHIWVIDADFFEEALFLWIEQEVKAPALSDAFRQAAREKRGLAGFVELLFWETGYWDSTAVQQLISQIEGVQDKSVLERQKLLADCYVENQKYALAILEYRRLLQREAECRKNPVICGKIWHNQGTALAGLFLFQEAKDCFLTAYKYHRNPASIHAAILADFYLEAEAEVSLLAERYGISENEYQSIRTKWQKAQESREILAFEAKLDTIFQTDEQNLSDKTTEIAELLTGWQKEYQKDSR